MIPDSDPIAMCDGNGTGAKSGTGGESRNADQ